MTAQPQPTTARPPPSVRPALHGRLRGDVLRRSKRPHASLPLRRTARPTWSVATPRRSSNPSRAVELEAGVVLLGIDADKLDVRPIVPAEVLYVSASPRAHTTASHDRAARRDAARLLRRRVRRQRPDPPPARRGRAGPRRPPAAERSRWSSRTSHCGSSRPAWAT